jgi:hypothetical protein
LKKDAWLEEGKKKGSRKLPWKMKLGRRALILKLRLEAFLRFFWSSELI